jgi:hypothetical protein
VGGLPAGDRGRGHGARVPRADTVLTLAANAALRRRVRRDRGSGEPRPSRPPADGRGEARDPVVRHGRPEGLAGRRSARDGGPDGRPEPGRAGPDPGFAVPGIGPGIRRSGSLRGATGGAGTSTSSAPRDHPPPEVMRPRCSSSPRAPRGPAPSDRGRE